MAGLIENFRYRPEIDGLRAVAVLAVVLFHAGLGLPGGFIGVDVFFVISGFLITSLILKDLEAGKFTLTNFWERRARRIIPASVVMVLAVLVAGWFLLMPSDYADLGKSAAWEAVFGANFHFWRSTNYFAGAAEEQPLLHTWSLAVEEQFYLFVPLLLLWLFRFPTFRRRGPLLAILGLGFLVSLAVSVAAVPRAPAAAFYLLPTRAWEMLCGSIVAILPAVALSRHLRELLCGLGLGAILIPCLLYTKETPFPGLAALPPCLGTALFIWGTRSPIQHSEFNIQNLLSARPVVFIGLISYSLYLWHWPLFAFSTYWALEPMSLGYRLTLVAASFALAILSWRFVETPFRKRTLGGTRGPMFIWAGAGLAASLLFSAFIVLQDGSPKRFTDKVIALDRLNHGQKDNVDRYTLVKARAGTVPRLGAPAPGPVGLLIWGDSHANAIIPGLADLPALRDIGVEVAWHPATAPVVGFPGNNRLSLRGDAPSVARSVINHVRECQIPNVLLVACWDAYLNTDSSTAVNDAFARAMETTVVELRATGCNVYLLRQVPKQKIPVLKAQSSHSLFRAVWKA